MFVYLSRWREDDGAAARGVEPAVRGDVRGRGGGERGGRGGRGRGGGRGRREEVAVWNKE